MYNFATSTTVYDALGNSHAATVAMRKRPDLPEQIDPGTGQPIAGTGVSNQWEYYLMFDGSSLGQVPGTMVAVGGGFMQFTDDGKLIAATGGSFEAQPGGVGPDGQPLPAGPPRLIPQPVDPDTGVPQFAVPFGGGNPIILGLNLGDGYNPMIRQIPDPDWMVLLSLLEATMFFKPVQMVTLQELWKVFSWKIMAL